jgi:hypothetical protein
MMQTSLRVYLLESMNGKILPRRPQIGKLLIVILNNRLGGGGRLFTKLFMLILKKCKLGLKK